MGMRSGLSFAVVRILGLLAATYLWADLAKTVITISMVGGTPQARGMSHESQFDLAPPTRVPLGAIKPNTTAESSRAEHHDCWELVYGMRPIPEAEYVIHGNTPDWSPSSDSGFPQARIIPSFKDGSPSGFKFVLVRPGSLHDNLGIRKGDILRRVNGYEMNSAESALKLYQRLRGCDRIEIELERRGEILRRAFRVEQ